MFSGRMLFSLLFSTLLLLFPNYAASDNPNPEVSSK